MAKRCQSRHTLVHPTPMEPTRTALPLPVEATPTQSTVAPACFPRVPLAIGFHTDCLDGPSLSVPSLPPLPHGRETDGCRYFYSSMAPPDPSSPPALQTPPSPSSSGECSSSKGFPHAPHEPLTTQPPHRTAQRRFITIGFKFRLVEPQDDIEFVRRQSTSPDRQALNACRAGLACGWLAGWPGQPPACRKARSETN